MLTTKYLLACVAPRMVYEKVPFIAICIMCLIKRRGEDKDMKECDSINI